MVGVSPFLALLLLAGTPELPGRAEADARPVQAKREAKPIASAAAIGSKWGIVTSVLRSRERNRAVGGAPNSHHLYGRAIDIARHAGVRHADIEAAYRKAGYVLIESLDEGDHSHFAFALIGTVGEEPVQVAAAAVPVDPCAADTSPDGRRRPDRWDGCVDAGEPKAKYRPIEPSAF